MDKRTSTFTMSEQCRSYLEELCKKENRNRSNMISQLIIEAYKKMKEVK